MTASTVVGAWFKSYSGAADAVPIDNVVYSLLPVLSQEPVNVPNVNLAHDNAGTLQNLSPEPQELEVFFGLQSAFNTNANRVDLRVAISADKVTWNEVDTNFEEILGTDSSYWTARGSAAIVDVPAGYYVGLVAKVESGATPQNFSVLSGFMHVRSLDGGNNPAIDAVASTINAGGYHLWQLSTVGTWVGYNGPLALSAGARGITHNGSGSFTNDTGEAQTVDGWFYLISRTNSLSGLRRQLFELSTNGVADTSTGYAATNRNAQNSGWVYYVATIDDGEFVGFRGKNDQNAGFQCRTYTLTHNARARE